MATNQMTKTNAQQVAQGNSKKKEKAGAVYQMVGFMAEGIFIVMLDLIELAFKMFSDLAGSTLKCIKWTLGTAGLAIAAIFSYRARCQFFERIATLVVIGAAFAVIYPMVPKL